MILYGLGREENGGLANEVIIQGNEGTCKGCNTLASPSKGMNRSTYEWSNMEGRGP